MKRPQTKTACVTTPSAILSIELLGSENFGSLAITKDQLKAINDLYGFVKEKSNKKPAPPIKPNREDFENNLKYINANSDYEMALKAYNNWEDPKPLLQAGVNRNAIRYAELDGLRIIAWIAKYLSPEEDPLKYIVQLAAQAGLDVNPEDIEWSDS